MRTNLSPAHSVLESRVLSHALRTEELAKSSPRPASATAAGRSGRPRRPPASRSADLHRRGAAFRQLAALRNAGSESVVQHARRRGALAGREYRRTAPRRPRCRFESPAGRARNRTGRGEIDRMLAKRMLDSNQQPVAAGATLRWLEKTPKNALRIPFFDRLYGDALFILLWRDPRENLSSIIEAWKARRWITYRAARWLGRTLVVAAAPGLARAQGPAAAGDRRRPVGNHQPHGARGPAQSAGGALDVAAVLRSCRESAPRGPTNLPIRRHRIRFRARATRRGIPAGVHGTP